MCLLKLHKFPRISTKPIKCYKKVTFLFDNKWETAVARHAFCLGDTIKSEKNPLLGIFHETLTWEVVHAFKEGRDDLGYMKDFNRVRRKLIFSPRFIECEIPPYTLYYLGDFGEIGASRIKTIKVV